MASKITIENNKRRLWCLTVIYLRGMDETFMKYVVDRFQKWGSNSKQLIIFTTHETALLNLYILPVDHWIYFVDKSKA